MTDASILGLEYWFSRSNRYEDVLVDELSSTSDVVPVQAVPQSELSSLLGSLDPLHRSWATTSRFKAGQGDLCLLPDQEGGLARVLLGLGTPSSAPWAYAALAKLPPGTYRLLPHAAAAAAAGEPDPAAPEAANADAASEAAASSAADRAALGFLLGHYSYDRYKKKPSPGGDDATTTTSSDGAGGAAKGSAGGEGGKARLVWPEGCNRALVTALARSYVWCRDLITTPAEDLGPQHLAAEVEALAAAHPGTSFRLLQGDQLLQPETYYPAVHMVGRACYRPPVLTSLEWSPPGEADPSSLPLLALVGKGVCFDSGGLDIKPAAGMKNMKKDMGGAALVMSLAHLVMAAGLRVRLLLVVPAVENSVSGNSYRPLDVLKTRAGISVENGNTDAEGRLILADALADAASRSPDLLLDAATLTGAARVALGQELPAVFTNDDGVWALLEKAAEVESEPLWRLPLHGPYRKSLESKVADLSSTGAGDGMAGAIIAALFLEAFVKGADRWIHIDTSAFTSGSAVGPGRPEGGEAQALRAVWRMLYDRYGVVTTPADNTAP